MGDENCTTNFDCLPYETNRLCYLGVDTIDTDDQGCGCNHYYGWIGEDCTEYSVTSYVNLGSMGVGFLLVCGFVLPVTVYLCAMEFSGKTGGSSRDTREHKKSCYEAFKTDRGQTICLTMASSVFATIWVTTRFLSTLDTSGDPLFSFTVDDDILTNTDYGDFGRYNLLQWYVGTPLSLFFGFLAIVNVALVWLDIAKSTRQLRVSGSDKEMKRKRLLIRVLQVVAVVVILVGNIVDRYTTEVGSLIGFFVLPVSLLIVTLYCTGYNSLTGILSASGQSKQFKHVIVNVRRTTVINSAASICLGFSWFLLSLYDNLYDLRQLAGTTEVEIAALLQDIQILSVCTAIFGLALFLYYNSKEVRKGRSRSRTSQSRGFSLPVRSKRNKSVSSMEEPYESMTSSRGGGPPSRTRRIKSPRDRRAAKNAQPVVAPPKPPGYLAEKVLLPGEEEEDEDEPREQQPYDNVKTQDNAGPPIGRQRRILSPRAKRELAQKTESEEDKEARHENEMFREL